MANVEKRGFTYRIKVCVGYDFQGKKITRSATYEPELFTATGKPKAESVIKKEVRAFADEFEQSVKSGQLPYDRKMKFEELVNHYLSQYAYIELSKGTAEGYENHLRKKLIPRFGCMKVMDLCSKPLEIQAFYNQMAKADRNGKKLSPSTIKRSIDVFSSVMSWAVDMQLAANNPLKNVKPPRKQRNKEKVKSFTLEDLKRFIQALDMPMVSSYCSHKCQKANGTIYDVSEYTETHYLSEQFKLFYIMAVFSGCRRGELIALDWNDIDFENGTLHIYKTASKTKEGVILKETKTESGTRIINMPSSVMGLARKWKGHQMELQLQLGTAWKGDGNIFCQAEGQRMYPDSVSAKFKDVLRNYNAQCNPDEKLPEISLHGLRHTSASILIYQKTDIAAVSKRLGHSRTSVTLDIYTHAIAEADKTAANTLEVIAKSAGIS